MKDITGSVNSTAKRVKILVKNATNWQWSGVSIYRWFFLFWMFWNPIWIWCKLLILFKSTHMTIYTFFSFFYYSIHNRTKMQENIGICSAIYAGVFCKFRSNYYCWFVSSWYLFCHLIIEIRYAHPDSNNESLKVLIEKKISVQDYSLCFILDPWDRLKQEGQ